MHLLIKQGAPRGVSEMPFPQQGQGASQGKGHGLVNAAVIRKCFT